MTEQEFNMASVRCMLSFLTETVKKISADQAEKIPEFVTLELAAQLKGGAAYNTYKSRPFLQPCGGTKSVRVGGKKCWRRGDVQEWLAVDDSTLESYLTRFGVQPKKY